VLEVICLGQERVGRTAPGAQMAHERRDGRGHRTIVIQHFNPSFAVPELLRDVYDRRLTLCSFVYSALFRHGPYGHQTRNDCAFQPMLIVGRCETVARMPRLPRHARVYE
jgi:hypothetical protein